MLVLSSKKYSLRLVPKIILNYFNKSERIKSLENLLGFKPDTLSLYEMALLHRSNSLSIAENNERLEFLGDAILGAIVGEHLYKKYPMQPEGFLTEMRSKIVNRQTLNEIAVRIGLKQLIKFNKNDHHLRSSQIFGNALEALIGAIYIDKGFLKSKKFIQQKIIATCVDLEALENEDSNLKNKLIGWATKNRKVIEFVLVNEELQGTKKLFVIGVSIDGKIITQAQAANKKEASKRAAKEAIDVLKII